MISYKSQQETPSREKMTNVMYLRGRRMKNDGFITRENQLPKQLRQLSQSLKEESYKRSLDLLEPVKYADSSSKL